LLGFVSLIFIAIIAACAVSMDSPRPVMVHSGSFAIDPQFIELYNLLGGEDVLGPAISPSFGHGPRKFQYVQAGCLEYNSELPASQAYRLSPLGVELGIREPDVLKPTDGSSLYVNGHVISGSFRAMYEKMSGTRFVGRPLTEVHYNESKRRYEQYFENLGFYETESEPGIVRLMALGAWKCDIHCRSAAPEAAIVELPATGVMVSDPNIAEAVFRLGPVFTGFALTNVYLTPEGYREQIFENVVLAAHTNSPAHVFTLPLAEKLGILPEPLAWQNNSPESVFFVVEDDLGYNILKVFIDYITLHGGLEISGPPIGEASLVRDGVYQQCFRNMCLVYDENSQNPDSKVRPKSLGYHYRNQNYHPSEVGFVESQSHRLFNVRVSEKYPSIFPTQAQELYVHVFEGITPLRDIEPLLQISLPDGTSHSFYFPPTEADGQTSLSLPAIKGQHGTLIPYQVCISSIINESFCLKESFVIVSP
jgi:hypothetical protein